MRLLSKFVFICGFFFSFAYFAPLPFSLAGQKEKKEKAENIEYKTVRAIRGWKICNSRWGEEANGKGKWGHLESILPSEEKKKKKQRERKIGEIFK